MKGTVSELKESIARQIEPHCSTDPNGLANYIFAMVSKEKPVHELYNGCIEKLHLFFGSENENVVQGIFDLLYEKEFFPEKSEKKEKDIKKSSKKILKSAGIAPLTVQTSHKSSSSSKREETSNKKYDEIVWTKENDNDFDLSNTQQKPSSSIEVVNTRHRRSRAEELKSSKRSYASHIDDTIDKASKRNYMSLTEHKPKYKPNNYDLNDDWNWEPEPVKKLTTYQKKTPRVNLEECNSVLIYNIPENLNKLDKLARFFASYGTVSKIIVGVEGDKSKSIVTFVQNESAMNVFRSPRPILFNRFVKVRLTKEAEEKMPEFSSTEAPNTVQAPLEPKMPKVDNEAILVKRQEQLDKVNKEMDIEKQKITLFNKLVVIQSQIVTKLGEKDLSPELKNGLLGKYNEIMVTIQKIRSEIVSITKPKKKIVSKISKNTGPKFQKKYLPQKSQLSIDNRTKKILVIKPDEEAIKNIQNSELLGFYKKFGQITSVECLKNGSIVFEYSSRFQAEKAINNSGYIYKNSPLEARLYEGNDDQNEENAPDITEMPNKDSIDKDEELVVTF